MSEWQPIETAPAKGEMILVGGMNWKDDWWTNFGHFDTDGLIYGDWHYDLEPTHWMPIPPPPVAATVAATSGDSRPVPPETDGKQAEKQ